MRILFEVISFVTKVGDSQHLGTLLGPIKNLKRLGMEYAVCMRMHINLINVYPHGIRF